MFAWVARDGGQSHSLRLLPRTLLRSSDSVASRPGRQASNGLLTNTLNTSAPHHFCWTLEHRFLAWKVGQRWRMFVIMQLQRIPAGLESNPMVSAQTTISTHSERGRFPRLPVRPRWDF